MHWFTGDEHFNHSNIITKFVFRPFQDVEEMNATIIQRHNERVKPGHTVFHLGDFKVSAQGPNVHELMAQLNGNHVFIQGNHDKRNGLNTPLQYAVIQSYGLRILLCHDPMTADEIMSTDELHARYDLAFVAHVHEKWRFWRNTHVDQWRFRPGAHGDKINVGVDQWDFYPVGAKQVLKAYKAWKRAINL